MQVAAMISDDEYRQLLEDARDALGELLGAVEPHESMRLRLSYGDICSALALADEDNERQSEHDERQASLESAHDGHAAWLELPRQEKRHLLLNAIGDERLIIRELLDRIRSLNPDRIIYQSDVQRVVRDLFEHGELDRVRELRAGKAWRWRYHRRVELSPELRSLERSLARPVT